METDNFIEAKVIAVHRTDGTVIPEQITIEDVVYPIDQVLRITPLVTTKNGGGGLKYEVLISGKRNALYLEDASSYCATRKWFRII